MMYPSLPNLTLFIFGMPTYNGTWPLCRHPLEQTPGRSQSSPYAAELIGGQISPDKNTRPHPLRPEQVEASEATQAKTKNKKTLYLVCKS